MKMEQKNTTMKYGKLKEVIARNPFAAYIGMELLEAADGYARARIRLQPQFEKYYHLDV